MTTIAARTHILPATVRRILLQLRHDRRTIGMIIGVPIMLIALLYFMFRDIPGRFDSVALTMLAVFPFVIMFLITSIAMLRERTSGTLERLMTTPTRGVDLLFGYGIAFGIAATVQASVAAACAYWLFGLSTAGGAGYVVLVSVITSLLGRRTRLAVLGFRPHRIPSGATTSGDRDPADPVVRSVRAAAVDGGLAGGRLGRHAALVRGRGQWAGGPVLHADRAAVARPGDRGRLCDHGAAPGVGNPEEADRLTNPARSGRRPGNPDTRQQILESAREAFAGNGFAKASIRKIAAGAGVDPALVHHYFGSKDELFLATVEVPVNPRMVVDQLVAGGPDGLGPRMISTILQVWESPAGASLIAAIRTAIGDPGTTRALSQFVTAEIVARLLRSLGYPAAEADLRGALVISQVLGVVVGRFVLGIEALAKLTTAELVASVGPTLQTYLTGPLPRP